jgi:hypothetical protein
MRGLIIAIVIVPVLAAIVGATVRFYWTKHLEQRDRRG